MNELTITDEKLKELLSNENTFAPILEKYFEFYQDKPFSGAYRLKRNVVIVESEPKTKSLDNESLSDFKGSIFQQAIDKANSDARDKRADKYNAVKNNPNRIKIVSEGDSWFQYPRFEIKDIQIKKGVKDIIDHLIGNDKFAIKSLDAAGDIIRNMYHQREYFHIIKREEPDFFLISAGGNDFFEVFAHMLQKNENPQNLPQWLGPNFETEITVLKSYYIALLEELVKAFPKLKIILHGYDYILPRIDGKWIGKPMINVEMNQRETRINLIKYIMDKFNEAIESIANHPNLKEQVHYLDIRETVPQVKAMWHDEIHPNDAGFRLVADKFIAKINELYTSSVVL